jgi:hypothetical protein
MWTIIAGHFLSASEVKHDRPVVAMTAGVAVRSYTRGA